MRVPDPKANTTTEAYLAYKAGYLEESELKPKLYKPDWHFDGWLAYWAGLVNTYPTKENGEPEMLTDEEALVAYLSGVTDTYPEEIKDPYDVRIVEYLKHLVSIRWPEPDYPVNNEEFYLSTMKPAFIPSGDPSSDIEIDGTAEGPFIDLKMYGDTYQKSYSGKNIYNINVAPNWIGIRTTYTVSNDELTVTGRWYVGFPIQVKANTTYYVSAIRKDMVVSGTTGEIRIYSAPNGSLIKTFTKQNNGSFNSGNNTSVFILFYANSGQEGDGKVTFSEIQVEEGSTATSYEPYVGGVPAPNPDYPQAVQTVTGRQVVAVTGGDSESAEYEINLGKNLIYNHATDKSQGGVDMTMNADGTVTANGNGTGTAFFLLQTQQESEGFAPGTYTIKCHSTLAYGKIVIEGYAPSDLSTKIIDVRPEIGVTEETFTLTAPDTRLRLSVVILHSSKAPHYFDDEIIGPFQLEVGSTTSSYATYFTPIELCKIGDYQDYIYKDGDDWYVHKEVVKNILDGSSAVVSVNTGLTTVARVSVSGTDLGASTKDIISNRFITKAGWNDDIELCYKSTSSSTIFLFINKSRGVSDVTTASNWLSNNPVIAYYALVTPTDTQITDATLIEQLNALMEGGSYEGKTYIKVTATDPNLPGLLYVEAGKYD